MGKALKNMYLTIFMYFTYVLQDNKGSLYKGMTNNLDRRLSEHKRGKTKTTRKQYETFEEARKRELYFKTASGRRFLKLKLDNKGA